LIKYHSHVDSVNELSHVLTSERQQKDDSEIARLLSVLERPFDEQPDAQSHAAPPPDWGTSR
jgi:uncharacterized protein YdiU (UPF0061 family)